MPPEDSLYLYTASHFYSFSNNRLQVNGLDFCSMVFTRDDLLTFFTLITGILQREP